MINKLHIQYDLGKIPPQSIDFEEAVIGAVLLESDSLIEIIDILIPESFYKEEHRIVYNSALNLFRNNKPIDILSISEQLKTSNELEQIGGIAYLSKLTTNIGSASHIEYHARIIQQKYIQRELIRISTEIQKRAFEDIEDIQELIDFSENELFNIKTGNVKKEPKHISEIGKEQIKLLEQLKDDEFSGIPTGLTTYDRIINGLQDEKLYIFAGRPGQGKTTLMISIARNMSIDFNKNVLIFTLEMSNGELWKKLTSDITDIQYGKLSNRINEKEWPFIESAQRVLEDSSIFIDDTPGLSLMDLRAKSRRLKMKKNIDVILIDYLQLMSTERKQNGNREQEISSISRGLKILSKELHVPIVCLSQLNRSVESRPDKKPQLSDLRESGAIEQDADVVTFIFRPEYYGFLEDENQESTINRVDLITSKNRGGKTGEVSCYRTENFTRIHDEVNKIEPINYYEKDNDKF